MNDGMKLCVALFTSFSLLPYFTFRFFFFFFFSLVSTMALGWVC